MSSRGAEKQKLHRTRREAGLICLRAVVDEVDVVEELILHAGLDPRDRDDRQKVEQAFQRARIAILPARDR